MEPSTTPSSLNSSYSSTTTDGEAAEPQVPRPDPEEPLLNLFPTGVFPTYRPVPVLVQVALIVLSSLASAATTWKHLRDLRKAPTVAEIFGFMGKALVFTVLSTAAVQDIFLRPSRLSTNTLVQRYFLPSALSKYEPLSISRDGESTETLGVHYLQYENPTTEEAKYDALYVNHGFGASSLSWLPAIPDLTKRLRAKICRGHDAVGFGFTDRPSNLLNYSTKGSARIAMSLLHKSTATLESVALFGHSLGALTTLKMALQLPVETSKLIVLCSPALGVKPFQVFSFPIEGRWWSPIFNFVRFRLIYPVFGFVLHRVVGTKNFWKRALRSVWGDPDKLKDSDALRFQWPSIGLGWERGFMQFGVAQITKFEKDGLDDDAVLLRRVLELPNTKMLVIIGSSDSVIPPKKIAKFFEDFEVPIVELQGLGHDSFEEGTQEFCDAVDDFLRSTGEVERTAFDVIPSCVSPHFPQPTSLTTVSFLEDPSHIITQQFLAPGWTVCITIYSANLLVLLRKDDRHPAAFLCSKHCCITPRSIGMPPLGVKCLHKSTVFTLYSIFIMPPLEPKNENLQSKKPIHST
eukprot:scaffold3827_cov179-Cylindrotheca_fusiformis.AAC.5